MTAVRATNALTAVLKLLPKALSDGADWRDEFWAVELPMKNCAFLKPRNGIAGLQEHTQEVRCEIETIIRSFHFSGAVETTT
jgi:hypothetical protein